MVRSDAENPDAKKIMIFNKTKYTYKIIGMIPKESRVRAVVQEKSRIGFSFIVKIS